ncbi:MAG: hypothetical protein LJE69_09410 [Thiohalocapsa sp.]|jgi:hypothetical protein|uniref:hypothetical protein n=1 Tax=Thiohalocapsa sp. TaxID=2497641 RepID=UPI0025ECC030|nr:hypothetical protein [Thiohalocapsa sp.]MCG6941455.1 hypothetical protein [Thiohalocapsa sp.]
MGQTADVATTAVGLSQGLAEANPAALPLIPAKVAMTGMARRMDDPEECREATQGLSLAGFGAAGWNLAMLAGVSTGGAGLLALGTMALLWRPAYFGAVNSCQQGPELPPGVKAAEASPFREAS